MNKIRWGIIGPGSIANNFADALKESYSGELKGIASLNDARRNDLVVCVVKAESFVARRLAGFCSEF